MIPLGASLWGQSCGDVFFTVLEPEPVDCYTVKVPVMLSSSSNVDICGMSIRGSVSSSYAAARQVDIASGITILNSASADGDEFIVSGPSSSAAFPSTSSQGAKLFDVYVDADPDEPFILALDEISFTFGSSCGGASCSIGSVTVYYGASFAATSPISMQGPSVASCASPAKVLDLDIDLDGMDILPLSHLEGQGQRAILPVKLVADAAEDLEGVRRIDFEIRFEDEYGNIEIATQDIFAPNSDFELEVAISKVMGTIRGSMIFNDVLPSIEESAAYPGRYEAEIFRIEAEAPYDAPQGGSVTFTANFVRAEFEGEDCCLAGLLGGGEVELDEFKYPCDDVNPGAFINILEPVDLGSQLRIRVRMPKTATSSLDQFSVGEMLVEIELFLEGDYRIDEAATEGSSELSCPGTCPEGGYPGAGCIEASAAKVVFGFCSTVDPVYADLILFDIYIDKGDCGSLAGIRVNRAEWFSASLGDCSPAVERAVYEVTSSQSGEVKLPCGLSGASQVGLSATSVFICGGGLLAQTDAAGEFDTGEDCAGEGVIELAAEKSDLVDCGLAMADIELLGQHILGVELLAEPWQYIAGDVDGNGAITTLDQIAIQRAIASSPPILPGKAWKFMPQGFDLAPSAGNVNPFAETDWAAISGVFECAEYDLSGGKPSLEAIKIGDVDRNCLLCGGSPGGASGEIAVSLSDNTTWQDMQEGQLAGALEVPAGAGISGLLGFQAALRYDTAKLGFEGIRPKDLPYVDTNMVGYSLAEPGVLRLVWFDHSGAGQALAAGEQLFELHFSLLDSSFSLSDIWLDTALMRAEAHFGGTDIRHLAIEAPGGMRPAPGATDTPAGRARVYPNPSGGHFVLQVDSAKDQAGRLVVLNAAGQAIHEQAIDLPQGQASFLIEASERWSAGIYYLQLYADGVPVFSEKLLRQ
jgi:hypothetical protein